MRLSLLPTLLLLIVGIRLQRLTILYSTRGDRYHVFISSSHCKLAFLGQSVPTLSLHMDALSNLSPTISGHRQTLQVVWVPGASPKLWKASTACAATRIPWKSQSTSCCESIAPSQSNSRTESLPRSKCHYQFQVLFSDEFGSNERHRRKHISHKCSVRNAHT